MILSRFTKKQAFNKLICTDLGAPFQVEIHSITSCLSYLGAVPDAVGVAVGHDEETGTLLAPAGRAVRLREIDIRMFSCLQQGE